MKLTKLNPILGNVEKIDRLFDPFFTGPLFPELMVKGFEGTWVPTLDLAENDAAFVIQLEVPGMPKENLDVKLTGEVLTISGHREADQGSSRRELPVSGAGDGQVRPHTPAAGARGGGEDRGALHGRRAESDAAEGRTRGAEQDHDQVA